MNKINKFIIISSIVSFILYLGMSLWLYLQNRTDTTGWASIGILAFAVLFVFPAIALTGGISGQIITRKVWLFPIINSIGASLFIATAFIFMGDIQIQVAILIPVVFTVTFIISAITMGIQKLFKKDINRVEIN